MPCVAVAETNLRLVGSASVTRTAVAVAGPLFLTLIVYVIFPPEMKGSGASVIVSVRSATALMMVVVCVAELLAVLESAVSLVTSAVCVMVT